MQSRLLIADSCACLMLPDLLSSPHLRGAVRYCSLTDKATRAQMLNFEQTDLIPQSLSQTAAVTCMLVVLLAGVRLLHEYNKVPS